MTFKDFLGQPGMAAKLALSLGVTRPAVEQWAQEGRRIPAERVMAVEQLTGIPRHELRPDLYPPAREAILRRAANDEAPQHVADLPSRKQMR